MPFMKDCAFTLHCTDELLRVTTVGFVVLVGGMGKGNNLQISWSISYFQPLKIMDSLTEEKFEGVLT